MYFTVHLHIYTYITYFYFNKIKNFLLISSKLTLNLWTQTS